jgi:hypothetical protein
VATAMATVKLLACPLAMHCQRPANGFVRQAPPVVCSLHPNHTRISTWPCQAPLTEREDVRTQKLGTSPILDAVSCDNENSQVHRTHR